MSLYLDFKNATIKNGKAKACYYRGHFYSYSYVLEKIDSLAEYLKNELHLHHSTIVTICLKNSLFSLELIYACNKLGIITNLINSNIAADQILFFDLLLNSRILFMDKTEYISNIKTYKNVKGKIALIDEDKISISKYYRNFKNRYILRDGVPFKFKNKAIKNIDESDLIYQDSGIGLTAPNEKFDERPYITCATNASLHQALINQSGIYDKLDQNNVMLSDLTMMSLALFMSFYHAPLCNGITICCDDVDNYKTYLKLLKCNKISIFCGDFGSFQRLFSNDDRCLARFIGHLNSAIIYNDTQRTYIYDIWKNKGNLAMKKVPLISTLGSVETLGVFISTTIDEGKENCFGKFLGDVKPHLFKEKKKSQIGQLQILSKSLMIGYYKSPNKSDLVIDKEYGILTDFNGGIDIEENFYLSSSKYNKFPYYHNASYLVNIKEMLMTIPGVKSLSLTVSADCKNTMELLVEADNKENNRITQEMTDYLDSQIKDMSYNINFKD